MSKGSKPRPLSVPRDEYASAWERTFGVDDGVRWERLTPREGSHVTPQMIEAMLARELAEMGIVHDPTPLTLMGLAGQVDEDELA